MLTRPPAYTVLSSKYGYRGIKIIVIQKKKKENREFVWLYCISRYGDGISPGLKIWSQAPVVSSSFPRGIPIMLHKLEKGAVSILMIFSLELLVVMESV